MGTRAQVLIKDTGVYLYQHWDGDGLFDTVVKAVNGPVGKNRQSDPDYLTRIIFSAMVKGQENEETGFGIGMEQHGDIEYLVTVDCEKQTITERDVELGKNRRTCNFEYR